MQCGRNWLEALMLRTYLILQPLSISRANPLPIPIFNFWKLRTGRNRISLLASLYSYSAGYSGSTKSSFQRTKLPKHGFSNYNRNLSSGIGYLTGLARDRWHLCFSSVSSFEWHSFSPSENIQWATDIHQSLCMENLPKVLLLCLNFKQSSLHILTTLYYYHLFSYLPFNRIWVPWRQGPCLFISAP